MKRRVACLGGLVLAAMCVVTEAVRAAEPSLAARVDELVAARFAGREPAPLCDDAEFARRVWLDFAGTVPTSTEVRAFLAETAADKRERLVDRLLAAPTHAARMEDWGHVLLMERRGDNEAWRRWLRGSFERNTPWDRMTREMLSPDGGDPERAGAGFFLAKRIEPNGQNPIDHPGLTRDVARLFLGVDLQCAQCHDHLFIGDYKQLEFQGLFAALKTLSVKTVGPVPTLVEKPLDKPLEFVSVFDPTPRSTGPRVPFPNGLTAKTVPPADVVPTGGASGGTAAGTGVLAGIAGELTSPRNPLFARNIANRLWLMMMGRGLVHPPDLHHADNPPSHPELMDLLAADIVARGFDLRGFLRELALTRTYQRGGRLAVNATGESERNAGAVPPESYLVFNERRLSAEQMFHSVLAATGNAARLSASTAAASAGAAPTADAPAGTSANPERADLHARFVAAFAHEPKEPEDRVEPSVKGALFVLNDSKFLGLWTRQPGNLADRLAALTDDRAVAEELYLSVLGRPPAEDEIAEFLAHLSGVAAADRERRVALWGWSLVASMEFTTNH